MENDYRLSLVEKIQKLDDEINQENFDVRYGTLLINSLMELWKLRIEEQIEKKNFDNTINIV